MEAAHLRSALLAFVSLSCSNQGFQSAGDPERDAGERGPRDRMTDAMADASPAGDSAIDIPSGETSNIRDASSTAPVDATTSSPDAGDGPGSGETQTTGTTEGRSDAATVVGDAAADDGGVDDSSGDDNRSDAGGTSTSVDVVDAAVPPLVCEDAGADAACVPDDCGSGSCESDGSTPVPECRRGDNPCATSQIVRFSGEHVLDGMGDEFCDVPGFELSFSNAAAGAADLPQSALVRVAWSPEALHLFAEVSDPDVAVNGNLDWLWDGDAVELYLATSEAAQLPGFFSGRIDGVQMVFAPPSGEQRARAARLFWLPNDDGSFRQVREEITRDFSARVTAEGYSIEAKVPWSKFGPRTPDMQAGMAIAFDLALSTASSQSLAAGGREGAAVLYVGDSASGVNTCDGDQLPWCNSTTWCSPVLQ